MEGGKHYGSGPEYAKLKITVVENGFQVVLDQKTKVYPNSQVLQMMQEIQSWADRAIKSQKVEETKKAPTK
jgi:hypothetical protein